MNSKQKIVQKQFLNKEGLVIRRLNSVYNQAAADIHTAIAEDYAAIQQITAMINALDPADPQIAVLKSMRQSKVYQKTYQESLQKQVGDILDKLQTQQYSTVSDYLVDCYEDGFTGALYDIMGQGIPVTMPINQQKVVHAVQLDSKISNGLYASMGFDVRQLRNKITAQISRSMVTGTSYEECADLLATQTGIGFNRAVRIARTEGHRIQTTAAMDAMTDAKDIGADVVKQWDSTLDGVTRESHRVVDGELRELDEAFSNGLQYPGDPHGAAGEVINCRCALLQRARWALDEGELNALKERAQFFGLDKSQNFAEFQQKFLSATASSNAPKKQYLTKKKLEQNIASGSKKLEDLKKEFEHLTGESFDDWADVINGLDPNDPADFQSFIKSVGGGKKLQSVISDYKLIAAQVEDWEDTLDKKLVSEKLKSLKKTKLLAQDAVDNFDTTKTWSNIWKNDVTLDDYAAKQGSIAAKKQYFENKLLNTNDVAEAQKWKDLLLQLDEYDKMGQDYLQAKSALIKATKEYDDLVKAGTLRKPQISAGDAFSQARKDQALWFDRSNGGFAAADRYFDPPAQTVYSGSTKREFNGMYTYTEGSGGHNRPLAGFQKPWNKSGRGWEEQYFVGSGKVWIDYEGKGEQIRGLTDLVAKSTYDMDVWMQSGQDFQTVEGFLQIPYGTLSSMTDAQMQQFVGYSNQINNFISCAVNEGGGSIFNSKPLKLNVYAPKGTQMLYVSDKGAFGKGENEMILQRGGNYTVTKMYWGTDATDGGRRKIFVDIEVHPEMGYNLFQQDPNEWKGSRKNYMNP